VAVVDGRRRITYGGLNRDANLLALRLRSLGVGPEVLVGVCVERSAEMIVAMLGILKAGGGYVPLDPNYPKDRVAFMLEDSQAPVVVTQRRLVAALPPSGSRVVCLDEFDWKQPGETTNVRSGVGPANLAYLIYTSGSTGTPKGVAIEHRSATVLVHWADEVFAREELAGVLFATSICFDLSVYELFVTLGTGGRVIVAQNALELPNLPAKDEVTLINTVPSAMYELVRQKAVPPSVSVVNLAGEPLKTSLVDQIYALGTVNKVYDLYGPSEDTTYSTCALRRAGAPATIGRPIANTQAYILDAERQPMPIGVAGEIYLGGEGLARGYLNRPELTAERFIQSQFAGESSSRLYRTGDLARYRADGNIEFLGRMDHQVKIRGVRIELGEIEAVLSRHPAVKLCVVLAREDSPGDKRLVAYVEMQSGQRAAVNDLREHLRTTLPDFMLPSAFVILEKLPLTSNGKIDRRALPKAGLIVQERTDPYVAPRDTIEFQLVRLWSKVLGQRRVGTHDNFFDLGGHSLLAVRIVVEIEKLYKRRLLLATLLQAPTIAELAEVLRQENLSPRWSCLVPIRAGGSRPPLLLMHSHGGNVLEYYPLANSLDQDQPVYALQARGLDGRIIRNPRVEEMASVYLDELKSLQPEGPYYLGGFCFGGLLALEAAQQLRAAGEEVALVLMIQTSHPAFSQGLQDRTFAHRWWYRLAKRIDLERENYSNSRGKFFREKIRRLWGILRARTAVAVDRFGGGSDRRAAASVPYLLELLSIEHDKAFANYSPRPYQGDVVLYRASKQLGGIVGDPYLGWKDLLQGRVRLCEVPGHQQNILHPSHVANLARELMSDLQTAQCASDPSRNGTHSSLAASIALR
jgi:amino acid adenylation domain-containing protein